MSRSLPGATAALLALLIAGCPSATPPPRRARPSVEPARPGAVTPAEFERILRWYKAAHRAVRAYLASPCRALPKKPSCICLIPRVANRPTGSKALPHIEFALQTRPCKQRRVAADPLQCVGLLATVYQTISARITAKVWKKRTVFGAVYDMVSVTVTPGGPGCGAAATHHSIIEHRPPTIRLPQFLKLTGARVFRALGAKQPLRLSGNRWTLLNLTLTRNAVSNNLIGNWHYVHRDPGAGRILTRLVTGCPSLAKRMSTTEPVQPGHRTHGKLAREAAEAVTELCKVVRKLSPKTLAKDAPTVAEGRQALATLKSDWGAIRQQIVTLARQLDYDVFLDPM